MKAPILLVHLLIISIMSAVPYQFCFGQSKPPVSSESTNENALGMSLALTIGGSFSGAKRSIESHMVATGYDDSSRGFFSGKTVKHPFTDHYPNLYLEITKYLNKERAIGFGLGLRDVIEVHGYDPDGGYMLILQTISTLSAHYMFAFHNQRLNFGAGPALTMVNTMQTSGGSIVASQTNIKPGLSFSSNLHIIEQKDWFITLDLKCLIAPKTEIGPFDPPIYAYSEETIFTSTQVNITTVNLGISYGFNFNR